MKVALTSDEQVRFTCMAPSSTKTKMPIGEAFDSILGAARTGAEWAWTRLYQEMTPPVLGYLRARGAHDPEDLLGEVYLQVVRDLARFEGDEGAFRAWMFQIAHHRLIDDRRYRGRRPELALDALATTRAGTDDVEAEVDHRINVDRIRAALAELSEDQSDVLMMRIIGGFTIPEIAEVMGKRIGAVKALQRRGLKALERIFGDEGVPF